MRVVPGLLACSLAGAVYAQLSPAAPVQWSARVTAGTEIGTGITVYNRCLGAHRFSVEARAGAQQWLSLASGEIALASGQAGAAAATIDARALHPGVHDGAVHVQCLDCALEPACGPQQIGVRLVARWPERELAERDNYVAGVVLVLLRSTSEADIAAITSEFGLRERRRFALTTLGENWVAFELANPALLVPTLVALEVDPRVGAVQPDLVHQVAAGDPLVASQYALRTLRFDPARADGDGRGVVVALIDTGIDTAHPDLKHATWITKDCVGDGWRTETHGTQVAGIIAAQRGNSEGIAGLAPRVELIAARACGEEDGSGRCTSSAVAVGIDWALGAGSRVINLAFAGPRDPLLVRLVRRAVERGALVIAAAGNRGPDAAPLYPAAIREALAITAIDARDNVYAKAARGAHISVAAPGVEVLSSAPGARYLPASGTSFAAAHVSALAALVLEKRPALDPAELRRALEAAARDLGAPGRDPVFGAGAIDACKLLGEGC